jgi:hypothetical protein
MAGVRNLAGLLVRTRPRTNLVFLIDTSGLMGGPPPTPACQGWRKNIVINKALSGLTLSPPPDEFIG